MKKLYEEIKNRLDEPMVVTKGLVIGVHLGFVGVWLALAALAYRLH